MSSCPSHRQQTQIPWCVSIRELSRLAGVNDCFNMTNLRQSMPFIGRADRRILQLSIASEVALRVLRDFLS